MKYTIRKNKFNSCIYLLHKFQKRKFREKKFNLRLVNLKRLTLIFFSFVFFCLFFCMQMLCWKFLIWAWPPILLTNQIYIINIIIINFGSIIFDWPIGRATGLLGCAPVVTLTLVTYPTRITVTDTALVGPVITTFIAVWFLLKRRKSKKVSLSRLFSSIQS